jgi:hypothetical protein
MNNAAAISGFGLAVAEQPQHGQLPVGQPEWISDRRLVTRYRLGGGAQVDAGAAGEVLDRGRQRHMLHRLTGRHGQHRRRGSAFGVALRMTSPSTRIPAWSE